MQKKTFGACAAHGPPEELRVLEVVDVSLRTTIFPNTDNVRACQQRSNVLLLPFVKACLQLGASESLGPTQSTLTGHRGRDLISSSFHAALLLFRRWCCPQQVQTAYTSTKLHLTVAVSTHSGHLVDTLVRKLVLCNLSFNCAMVRVLRVVLSRSAPVDYLSPADCSRTGTRVIPVISRLACATEGLQ